MNGYKTNQSKKDEWLKEPVSEDLKKQIFAKVQVELEENRKQYAHNLAQEEKTAPSSIPQSPAPQAWWKSLSFLNPLTFNPQALSMATLCLAIVGVLVFRSLNIIDVQNPNTSFSELATLSPDEFEVIENLEYIDQLDQIDLDEIRKEMRKSKANKG